MRVLLVHERYKHRGGEDVTFEREAMLLRSAGVEVSELVEDNHEIRGSGSLALALQAIWSQQGRALVREAIRTHRPDIMHVHNSFPLLSPAIYGVAQAEGVRVVQTLHNYRTLCANALLLRDNAPCEACVSKRVKWPAVVHACYRGSRTASAAVAAMAGVHHVLGTWRTQVDCFIALTNFARARFIAGGIPAERIAVRAVPVDDPGPELASWDKPRRGVLFVGRLSPEKGLDTVLAAWPGLPWTLTVIGPGEPPAGPLPSGVTFAGGLSAQEVSRAMAQAAMLVFPSRCYETFALVIAEAMAHGLPVIAAAGGAAETVVQHGETGVVVPRDDVVRWRAQITEMLADPKRLRMMGEKARAVFSAHYAPAGFLAQGLDIYNSVLAGPSARLANMP
jgi:glycosyltransferase involved in cell wall biosynthesis